MYLKKRKNPNYEFLNTYLNLTSVGISQPTWNLYSLRQLLNKTDVGFTVKKLGQI